MTDDERLEQLLRTRPRRDARYEPVAAALVDAGRGTEPVLGSLRWGRDRAGFSGTLVFVVLVSAILVAAALMVVGAPRTDDRVVMASPRATLATTKPAPDFPVSAVSAVLERFQADRWGTTPVVVLDMAVSIEDRAWFVGSRPSLATSATGEMWPGQTVVRPGAVARFYLVAAILRLADDGRLRLDDPVSRYVSSWPAKAGLTIRHLLDGSSGVSAFGEPVEALEQLVAEEPSRTWKAADALALAADRERRFPPGARHEPVDTEATLLAAVIESITGKPVWDAFLELFGSELAPPPTPIDPAPPSDATGSATFLTPIGGLWDPTDSGTPRTVSDMPKAVLAVEGPAQQLTIPVAGHAYLLDAFHRNPALLSDASRALLDRPVDDGGFGGMAICPCTGETRDGVGWIGHLGPYTSYVVYVPSRRLSIALVANAPISDNELGVLVDQIFAVVGPAIP